MGLAYRTNQPVYAAGKSTRVDFENFFRAQTEGITRSVDGSIYVYCEQSPLVVSSLYRGEI